MIRTFTTRRAVVAGAAVALALALGGCSSLANVLNGDSATRDDQTNEVTEGGTVDVFEVSVGDCIGNPAEGEITDVEVVPCDDPHDGEVYYEFELDEGEWPGDAAVSTAAEEGCTAAEAFEAFIGTPYDESTVWVQFLLPTEEAWTDTSLNDRLISCIAYVPDEQQTASLKDSGL